MGRSVLRPYPDAGRVFVATYQMPRYLTPDPLVVVLRPGRKIKHWRLNAKMDIVAPLRQPDPMVERAISAHQETARRARDGFLQHVNPSDGLRMR